MGQMKPFPFQYPLTPLVRKHAPRYDSQWEPYRDWLRDDFDFRCVYCLQRERWGKRRAVFAIDHIVSRADGGAVYEYGNLAYACASCNSAKSDSAVPHPEQHAYGRCVEVDDEGRIHARNREGKLLLRALLLDDEENTEFRRDRIHELRTLAEHNPAQFERMMSYPDNLPDFRSRRSRNAKPDSWKQSHLTMNNAGKLY
jgi:hypothetical protein